MPMNKIEKLIKELCPNGVEWKNVKDVILSLKTGLNPRDNFKLNEENADCFYITGKEIYNNRINISEKTDLILREVVQLINKRAQLHSNVLLFASTGTGTVGRMAIVKDYKEDWNVSETLYIITTQENIISIEYLMYILYSDLSISQYAPKISKGSVPHLKVVDLLNVSIPVPPLPIQTEIVRILDKFVEQQEQLERLIELRKKQYEYYREEMLKPKEGEKWETKTLGEICTITRGKRLTKSQLSETAKYKVYHGGIDPIGYYKECNRKADTVMVINVGASAGTIGYSNEDFWSSDGCFCLSHTDIALSRFLYYSLLEVGYIIESRVRHAGIPTLDSKVLEELMINIPSKQKQNTIINSLKEFESSISALTSALELSKKRYEYYRDKMLRF